MAKETLIGERRDRIRFEQPTAAATRAAGGGEIWNWTRVAEVWAKVVYQNTRSEEQVLADQVVVSTAIAFDIAYRDGITEKMRIVFDGSNFDIMYIQKPDYKKSLVIQAVRVE